MIREDDDFQWYCTCGPSMFPLILGDDYVLVKKVPVEDILLGDTIVFESGQAKKVCHRVVEIERKEGAIWFHAACYKDDASNACDKIRQDKVCGKVVAIKRKGAFMKLHDRGRRPLLLKLHCFLAVQIFNAKIVLSKIPLLKKSYYKLR